MNKMYGYSKKFFNKCSNIDQSIYNIVTNNYIVAYWSNNKETRNNWGDAVNPYLIEKLSGKTVLHVNEIFTIKKQMVYSVIGSILDHVHYSNLIVWGSGFKSPKSKIKVQPELIKSVRGPYTRKLLLDSGIECPDVYGDPGLLISHLYKPKQNKIYKLGFIPHYIDMNTDIIKSASLNKDINIIDIKSGIHDVVNEVLKCEVIASSSLHGLIIADSYLIPNIWIKLSNNIAGGNFKYLDYYASLGIKNINSIDIESMNSVKTLIELATVHDVDLYEPIYSSCPFL